MYFRKFVALIEHVVTYDEQKQIRVGKDGL